MPVTMCFSLPPASRLFALLRNDGPSPAAPSLFSLALLLKYWLSAACCCQDPSIDWVKRMAEWTGLEPEVVTYGTK